MRLRRRAVSTALRRRGAARRAFQLELAERDELVSAAAAGQQLDHLGASDRARLGRGFETLSLHDRESEAVASFKAHVARRDPDPHPHCLCRTTTVGSVDLLLQGHRRGNRTRGTRERGHEPVAEMLHDAPAVGRDRVGEDRIVHATETVRGLLAETRPHRCAARQIREHHRDGAYFTCTGTVCFHSAIMLGRGRRHRRPRQIGRKFSAHFGEFSGEGNRTLVLARRRSATAATGSPGFVVVCQACVTPEGCTDEHFRRSPAQSSARPAS